MKKMQCFIRKSKSGFGDIMELLSFPIDVCLVVFTALLFIFMAVIPVFIYVIGMIYITQISYTNGMLLLLIAVISEPFWVKCVSIPAFECFFGDI